ncbi:MAG: ATP-binding cassette domain-containing protein [Clostridiales bacterium]|nr:ATP-binding cassette domain-containing protein [Clostridiales bacterium]
MNDIVLKNVTKTFGEKIVIDNFSCTFLAGNITCIEGGSGQGKTTLLNLISGIISPDKGSIYGVPERISFVFQEDRLCEDFTAVSNLRLVCKKPKAELEAHLRELHLGDDLKKPVKEYSGGMKRRVAVARAICYDGDCVLLDEPFKGLDETLKKTVMDYVLKYTKGKTVICVTHDRSEAGYLGGRLITLNSCREE